MNKENIDTNAREVTDTLIRKYLENCSTNAEKETLLKWVQESEEHQQYFKQWAQSWEKTMMVFRDEEEDRELLQEIHRRIGLQKSKRLWYRIATVAAVAVICFFSVKTFITKNHTPNYVTVITENEKKQIILPDSSLIWLNQQSSIKYPKKISRNRNIILVGEAYFDVKKDSRHPFVVYTENLTVKVTGTQFVVTDKKESPTGEVILEEGGVQLMTKDSQENYLLHPNQKLKFDKQSRQVDIKHVDAKNYTNWKNNRLFFFNTPLRDVFIQLEKWYNISIVCDDEKVKNTPVSFTVDNETEEDIFNMISLVTHFNYTIKDHEIVIR